MITGDDNLSFLQEKIAAIRIAIFKAECNSILQLPNNIISTLKVDSDGFIWFYTSCNGNYANQIDKEFFAYLEYYQKGNNARLRINGKACVVEGDREAAAELNDSSAQNLLLLKLKIMHAEYFENDVPTTWVHKIKSTVNGFLFSQQEKKFDFT